LKRFEMSLFCAAPNISDKEKTMVLATKLSTDAFAELQKCCLPQEVTDYTYEETVTRLRLLFTKGSDLGFASIWHRAKEVIGADGRGVYGRGRRG
jgi:hypothetical protein